MKYDDEERCACVTPKIMFSSCQKLTQKLRVDIAKHSVKVRDHALMLSSTPGSILVTLKFEGFLTSITEFVFSFLTLQTDSSRNLRPQFESKCIQLAGKIQTSENKCQTKKLKRKLDAGGKPSTWFPPGDS